MQRVEKACAMSIALKTTSVVIVLCLLRRDEKDLKDGRLAVDFTFTLKY